MDTKILANQDQNFKICQKKFWPKDAISETAGDRAKLTVIWDHNFTIFQNYTKFTKKFLSWKR